jgi:hypothetical protein
MLYKSVFETGYMVWGNMGILGEGNPRIQPKLEKVVIKLPIVGLISSHS